MKQLYIKKNDPIWFINRSKIETRFFEKFKYYRITLFLSELYIKNFKISCKEIIY